MLGVTLIKRNVRVRGVGKGLNLTRRTINIARSADMNYTQKDTLMQNRTCPLTKTVVNVSVCKTCAFEKSCKRRDKDAVTDKVG